MVWVTEVRMIWMILAQGCREEVVIFCGGDEGGSVKDERLVKMVGTDSDGMK